MVDPRHADRIEVRVELLIVELHDQEDVGIPGLRGRRDVLWQTRVEEEPAGLGASVAKVHLRNLFLFDHIDLVLGIGDEWLDENWCARRRTRRVGLLLRASDASWHVHDRHQQRLDPPRRQETVQLDFAEVDGGLFHLFLELAVLHGAKIGDQPAHWRHNELDVADAAVVDHASWNRATGARQNIVLNLAFIRRAEQTFRHRCRARHRYHSNLCTTLERIIETG